MTSASSFRKPSVLTPSLAAVAILAASPTSRAAWALLDNFDSYDNVTNGTKTIEATGGVWSSEFVGTNNSHVVDSDLGQSLATYGGAAWRGAERDLTGTDAAVTVGEVQTYFWQINATSTGGGFDFMMGLSPGVSNIDSVDAWRDFNVMPFVNNGATTPFINAEAATSPWWAPMTAGVWYNVWVVVDNNATAPTFDLYYSAGSNPAVLVAENANWRNTGESGMGINQNLNAIGFMAAGGAGSQLLIDNIYYSTGELLTNPVPEVSSALLGAFGLVGLLRRRR